MWFIREPSAEQVARFIANQSRCEFTYSQVGATTREPPAGFTVDSNRIELGRGQVVFAAVIAALSRWDHFRLGWVEACPAETAIRPGTVVAVKARVCGLWTLNACRVVYVVDEPGSPRRFGFAYGTLPAHAERGEERFLIECDPADNRVWYTILAFSRPKGLTWLGYPLARALQRRFARDSLAAMRRASGNYPGAKSTALDPLA